MGRLAETRSAAGRSAGRGGETWYGELGHFESGDAIDTDLVHEYRGVMVAGDLAVVLKALHRPTNLLQAVKVIHPGLIEDEAMQHLFEEEAERLQGVDADYAARLADYGRFSVEGPDRQVRTFWYFATDWIDGRSVRDLLRGGPGAKAPTFSLSDDSAEASLCPSGLASEDAFSILDQAAQAVAELHRAGCSHLAIRPENLLMTRQGRVRLIGMGVPADLRRAADSRLGTMWQGSRYAPPEVTRGDESETGPASDVYQLAVLAFELFMGVPCSPFLAYDEICEAAPFVPPALDRLIVSCLGVAGSRPCDADAFAAALREVTAVFEANVQKRRRTPARKAREVWQEIGRAAGQQPPLWSVVAGGCRRLVEEKPHLLPFGKIPRERVEELLLAADAGLEASRKVHLEELAAAGAWQVAEEFIERLGGDVAREEQDELRVALARAAVTSLPRASAQRRTAIRRLQETIGDSRIPVVLRDQASAVLNEAVIDAVPPTGSSIPVVTEAGVIPPVERFRVESAGEVTIWRVVVGPALRLGRGSFDEFGNHVDLRPTRREAAESSITVNLAQRISRAGHLELRLGGDGLEVFCLGTHGATIEQTSLLRGERVALGEHGRGLLAQGAVEFMYRVWKNRDGVPVAVSLDLTAGVGAGRRAAWVLSELPFQILAPNAGAKGSLIPTADGWLVDGRGEGLRVGGGPSGKHSRVPWPDDTEVELGAGVKIRRG